MDTPNFFVGTGQIHTRDDDPFYRVEVDLTNDSGQNEFNTGYIWIQYTTGNLTGNGDNRGDFALGNVYLELAGYEIDQFIETEGEITSHETTFEVLDNAINFYGLPTEDPGEEGALYKDPEFSDSSKTYVLISTGSAG